LSVPLTGPAALTLSLLHREGSPCVFAIWPPCWAGGSGSAPGLPLPKPSLGKTPSSLPWPTTPGSSPPADPGRRAEAAQALAQRHLRLDQTALNALLGRDLGAAVDLVGELDFQPVGAELASLRQQALARRPDLQRAGAQVAGAQAGQRLATSALLPDLSVAVSRQQLRGEGDFWRTGLSLAVPLWALGRQRGEISRAGSELGRARAEQLQARNRALLEVEQAYQEVRAAEEQVRLCRDRVLTNAEETYRVFRRRYDEGRSGYLEVIDAGRTLAESRAAATEALLIYHTAAADLNRAVGGNSADYERGEAR